MPLSYKELRAMLDVDEPDYPGLTTMAAGAMKHVRKLAASGDVTVATKAVSLAGMIGGSGAIEVVSDAAKSDDPVMRIAAAHAAAFLPDHPKVARIVGTLLADDDVGVVKLAARAASSQSDRSITSLAKRAASRLDAEAAPAGPAKRTKKKAKKKAAAKKAAAKKAKGASPLSSATVRQRSSDEMPTGVMGDQPTGDAGGAMPSGEMT